MTTDLDLTATATPLAAGGGCAAKMGPGSLAAMLALSGLAATPPLSATSNLPANDMLVGLQTGDDAAVIRLSDDLAIVQTVDFFTPIVPEPETFGAIAAANAMSDIFAMGGRVLTALSILAVPESMDLDVSAAILRGAAAKVREAGGQIVGGHSIYDEQVKFGLAVTGRVHPDQYWARSTAMPGDVLFLTKPLGTALLMTADRAGDAEPGDVDAAIASMLRLNLRAGEIAIDAGPNAVTDVTGFGLLGHLAEMVVRSGVGSEIVATAVPILDGAREAARRGHLSGGLGRNRDYWLGPNGRDRTEIRFGDAVDQATRAVLWDPQTSGGLLLAIPERRSADLIAAFVAGDEPLWRIGQASATPGIRVTP